MTVLGAADGYAVFRLKAGPKRRALTRDPTGNAASRHSRSRCRPAPDL